MNLPALLHGLEEQTWRTKAGSAQILGAMAFCAPMQLAVLLPQFIPKLADGLADAHPKVVEFSESVLSRIGAVARNPEVRNLAPFLIAALKDPATRTSGALDALLATEFIHAVDTASLALLIPSLHRGLRSRSTVEKKKAAAIVGSICSHVSDPSDVVPYVDTLIMDLRVLLLDPIPEARRVSAKALGALSTNVGEGHLPDLLTWLKMSLGKSTLSSAERSGIAMGLAEISACLSAERLDTLLEEIIFTASWSKLPAASKEGAMFLAACLPVALHSSFESMIPSVLPIIIRGLADDSEVVREAAQLAGQSMVFAFGKSSTDLLLPSLLSGMNNGYWRIRTSSVELVGDLMMGLAGVPPVKMGILAGMVLSVQNVEDEEAEDDENAPEEESSEDGEDGDEMEVDLTPAYAVSPETVSRVLTETLGEKMKRVILSNIYICRNDVSQKVRVAAMQVWKKCVFNTPKTLRDTLPQTIDIIVESLGGVNEEKRSAASRTLGDLVSKLGDAVLLEVLPALQRGLSDEDQAVKRGSYEGLEELIRNATKEQIQNFSKQILATLDNAVSDSVEEVRSSSAEIFSLIVRSISMSEVERFINQLVTKVSSSDAEASAQRLHALDGLQKILQACGPKVVNHVVPKLTSERPLSLPNALTISVAIQASGEDFEQYLEQTVAALLYVCVKANAPEVNPVEIASPVIRAICASSEDMTNKLFFSVGNALMSAQMNSRIAGAVLLGAVCVSAPKIAEFKAQSILESMIRQFSDSKHDAVLAAADALVCFTTSVPVETTVSFIPMIRQNIRVAASSSISQSAKNSLVGLENMQGVAPFVPVITHGLLNGSPTDREQCALALAEIVALSTAAALKPFTIKFAGPVIRVMAERNPWQVKAAVLLAIDELLVTAGAGLKAFAPQLQSTLLKNLVDPSKLVRNRSKRGLGELCVILPRSGPLLKELVKLASLDENSVAAKVTVLQTLGLVLSRCSKVDDAVYEEILESALNSTRSVEQAEREACAAIYGGLSVHSSAQQLTSLVSSLLVLSENNETSTLHGVGQALHAVLFTATRKEINLESALLPQLVALAENMSRHDTAIIRGSAAKIASGVLVFSHFSEASMIDLVQRLITTDSSLDVIVCGIDACSPMVTEELKPKNMTTLFHTLLDLSLDERPEVQIGADYAMKEILVDGRTVRVTLYERVLKASDAKQAGYLKNYVQKLKALPDRDAE